MQKYTLLAGLFLVGCAVYLLQRHTESFSPFYELPRRDPKSFIRTPLEYKQ